MGRAQNTHLDPFSAVFGSKRGTEHELTAQGFLDEAGFKTPPAMFFAAADEDDRAFILGRWPYTYAYDYVRATSNMSRGDVSAALHNYARGDADAEEQICTELASLYCKWLGITIPDAKDLTAAF